jgi:hypothetical protein
VLPCLNNPSCGRKINLLTNFQIFSVFLKSKTIYNLNGRKINLLTNFQIFSVFLKSKTIYN